MKRLKSYSNFSSLNESIGFGNSNEYFELKGLFDKREKDEFNEYFYDLTDENIAKVSTWSWIADSEGHSIGYSQSSVNLSSDHFIFHTIKIETEDSINLLDLSNLSDIRNIGSNLIKISNSIESFTKSIGSENVKVKIEPTISNKKNNVEIYLSIKGSKIDRHTFETFYKKWKNDYGPKYDEGLNYLIGEYQHHGIQNPPIDTNDTGDYVAIGFFLEDEIIVVADYDKKTDKFRFDWGEFDRSVKEWRIENA